MTRDHVLFSRLVTNVKPGCRLLGASELTGGISAEMTVLEVETPDGSIHRWVTRQPGAAVLRQNPRAAEIEFLVLLAVHAQGIAAPAPLWLDASGEFLNRPCLVMGYIDGQPDYAPTDLGNFTRQFATHLATIHRADLAGLDVAFLPAHDGGLSELERQPSSHDSFPFDVVSVRAALERAWPIARRNPTCLLHGDCWPGNVLWRDGRLVGMVDWEDAALGDPLTDLAISRLDLCELFGIEIMEAFTREYLDLNPLDTSFLALYDLIAALRLARLAGADLEGWAGILPSIRAEGHHPGVDPGSVPAVYPPGVGEA